jgi:hypothetical protein
MVGDCACDQHEDSVDKGSIPSLPPNHYPDGHAWQLTQVKDHPGLSPDAR